VIVTGGYIEDILMNQGEPFKRAQTSY